MTELATLTQLEQLDAYTGIGLRLPAKMRRADYEALGFVLGKLHTGIQFAIGDYILEGEKQFGQESYQLQESLQISEEQRKQYVRVAERVPYQRRRHELTWSHHREVAALEPVEQDAWLAGAVEAGWSKAEMVAHLRPDDVSERELCEACGRPL